MNGYMYNVPRYVLYMSQGKWGKYGNNTRRLTYEIT